MDSRTVAGIFCAIIFVVGLVTGWGVGSNKTANELHQRVAELCPEDSTYSRELVACVRVIPIPGEQ